MASYEVKFSGKELIYFLFRRKRCPTCHSKLVRRKQTDRQDTGLTSVELGEFYVGDNHKVTLYYECRQCGRTYSLNELANMTSRV